MKASTGITETFIHMYLLVNFHHAFIPLWLQRYVANIIWNLQVQAENRFRNNVPLILREYWSEKNCIFQIRTYKVPIEEMTDRWETENSDGWQSMDCSAIRFCIWEGESLPQRNKISNMVFLTNRPACWPYSLIAHKLGKLPYYLPILWQSRRLQTTNWNFRHVFFWTQQGMFSAAPNELSCFKLDVRRNMARYVLSNSKPFGLLPKFLHIPRTSPSEVGWFKG